ncbi:PIG-L family deacetylase [Hymenobacter sp. UYP22]|uniref:PIG-L family deacetylase n=1 Tax=Hymenobacter sp. UYP22 TaxID=3156348 RepID=UPI00339769B5
MRKNLLWGFLLFFLCQIPSLVRAQSAAAPAPCQPTPKWTAIITAHPDDWQLFMGAAISEEAKHTRRKIVFVCLTGGQADEPADSYWQSREASHRASVRQIANPWASLASTSFSDKLQINGHSIDMYRSQNLVAFYLHLPDGGVHGRGLARGSFQSLKLLRDAGKALTPLNGGAPYTSWDDLSQTVRELLAHEAIKGQLTLHTAQTDIRLNSGDHSDHYMAGQLAQHTMRGLECRFLQYVGYDVSKRPVNLSSAQISSQQQAYRAYCQTMVSLGQEDPWDTKHLAFVGHQYVQVKHQAGPQLPPTAPAATTGQNDDEDALLADHLVLQPAFPNPFSASSQLTFDLPIAAPVWLRVLDMQGREVVQLLRGESQQAGRHDQWLDVQRFPASGTYVAELRVGKYRRQQKLSVVR